MKLKVLAAIVATVVLVLPAGAGAAPRSANGPDFAKIMQALNDLKQKTGEDFDITYINTIVQHHLDAIMMAEAVKDVAPTQVVREEAASIIEEQQKEIEDLTTIMKEDYNRDVTPDQRMKMSPSMMDMLQQAEPVMREKMFLGMMREHHQIAMFEGDLVLQKSGNAKLRDQAQMMLASQKPQQDRFGGYLVGIYNITPPTPTGDMQHGMDAAMQQMAAPAATPAANPQPAGGTAPSTNPTTPATLPITGSDGLPWLPFAVGIFALLAGGFVLRRIAR